MPRTQSYTQSPSVSLNATSPTQSVVGSGEVSPSQTSGASSTTSLPLANVTLTRLATGSQPTPRSSQTRPNTPSSSSGVGDKNSLTASLTRTNGTGVPSATASAHSNTSLPSPSLSSGDGGLSSSHLHGPTTTVGGASASHFTRAGGTSTQTLSPHRGLSRDPLTAMVSVTAGITLEVTTVGGGTGGGSPYLRPSKDAPTGLPEVGLITGILALGAGVESFLAFQLLALFATMGCAAPGLDGGGRWMRYFLTPLDLSRSGGLPYASSLLPASLDPYGRLLGQAVIAVSVAVFYCFVLLCLTAVLAAVGACSGKRNEGPREKAVPENEACEGTASKAKAEGNTVGPWVHSNTRAKDLLRHPRLAPVAHQLLLTGATYESCLLLYGRPHYGPYDDGDDEEGVRIAVGAMGLGLCVASVAAVRLITYVGFTSPKRKKAVQGSAKGLSTQKGGDGGEPYVHSGASADEHDLLDLDMGISARGLSPINTSAETQCPPPPQMVPSSANTSSAQHPPAPAASRFTRESYRSTQFSIGDAILEPLRGEPLLQSFSKYASADLRRVWGPARLLFAPKTHWHRSVQRTARCVHARLRPSRSRVAAGHTLFRALLVAAICAIPADAEKWCVAILIASAAVCAAHAGFVAYTRCYRVPIESAVQSLLGLCVCAIAIASAVNTDSSAYAIAVFMLVAFAVSIVGIIAAVAAFVIEKCFLSPMVTRTAHGQRKDAVAGDTAVTASEDSAVLRKGAGANGDYGDEHHVSTNTNSSEEYSDVSGSDRRRRRQFPSRRRTLRGDDGAGEGIDAAAFDDPIAPPSELGIESTECGSSSATCVPASDQRGSLYRSTLYEQDSQGVGMLTRGGADGHRQKQRVGSKGWAAASSVSSSIVLSGSGRQSVLGRKVNMPTNTFLPIPFSPLSLPAGDPTLSASAGNAAALPETNATPDNGVPLSHAGASAVMSDDVSPLFAFGGGEGALAEGQANAMGADIGSTSVLSATKTYARGGGGGGVSRRQPTVTFADNGAVGGNARSIAGGGFHFSIPPNLSEAGGGGSIGLPPMPPTSPKEEDISGTRSLRQRSRGGSRQHRDSVSFSLSHAGGYGLNIPSGGSVSLRRRLVSPLNNVANHPATNASLASSVNAGRGRGDGGVLSRSGSTSGILPSFNLSRHRHIYPPANDDAFGTTANSFRSSLAPEVVLSRGDAGAAEPTALPRHSGAVLMGVGPRSRSRGRGRSSLSSSVFSTPVGELPTRTDVNSANANAPSTDAFDAMVPRVTSVSPPTGQRLRSQSNSSAGTAVGRSFYSQSHSLRGRGGGSHPRHCAIPMGNSFSHSLLGGGGGVAAVGRGRGVVHLIHDGTSGSAVRRGGGGGGGRSLSASLHDGRVEDLGGSTMHTVTIPTNTNAARGGRHHADANANNAYVSDSDLSSTTCSYYGASRVAHANTTRARTADSSVRSDGAPVRARLMGSPDAFAAEANTQPHASPLSLSSPAHNFHMTPYSDVKERRSLHSSFTAARRQQRRRGGGGSSIGPSGGGRRFGYGSHFAGVGGSISGSVVIDDYGSLNNNK